MMAAFVPNGSDERTSTAMPEAAAAAKASANRKFVTSATTRMSGRSTADAGLGSARTKLPWTMPTSAARRTRTKVRRISWRVMRGVRRAGEDLDERRMFRRGERDDRRGLEGVLRPLLDLLDGADDEAAADARLDAGRDDD